MQGFHLAETEVIRLFSSRRVQERLEGAIGADVRAMSLSRRGDTYRVSGSGGDFIFRFPGEPGRTVPSTGAGLRFITGLVSFT